MSPKPTGFGAGVYG